jgi:hypothetical protein
MIIAQSKLIVNGAFVYELPCRQERRTSHQIFLVFLFCLVIISLNIFKVGHDTLKIGLISDTHLSRFDQRLAKITGKYFKDVDFILHAGDIVDLRVLEGFGDKEVKAVYGNMDPLSVQGALPQEIMLDLMGFKVALIHGWGMPLGIEKRIINKIGRHVDCVIYGHTHKACIKNHEGILFLNPGSPTDKRFADRNTIGILEIGEKPYGRIIELTDEMFC